MTALESFVIDSIDEVNENQWNNVVSESECGTVFHQTGWIRSIETALDKQPRHVVVQKGNNPISVFPNFGSAIELPATLPVDATDLGATQLSSVDPGFGGPLIIGKKEPTLEALYETLNEIYQDDFIFHRMQILDSQHVQYAQTLRKWGYRPSLLYCRCRLRLDSYERILQQMDKERRKEIRDAKSLDYEVQEEDVDQETIERFYTEYLKTMERVNGTPYPLAFFKALADNLANKTEIFTAYVDGQSTGKHLYLRDDNQDSLHYFFAGTDDQYFEYSVPTLLHNYALRWGIENGYSTFDFGSTNANYANGTFKYKRKFGAELEPIYEWEKGTSVVRWPLYLVARKLYRRFTDTLES